MEEILKSVIDWGIGATKALETNLRNALKTTEQNINSLIEKGNDPDNDSAVRIKKFVNDLLISVQDYESKVKEITTNLTRALQDVQTLQREKSADLQKGIEKISEKLRSLLK